MVEGGGARAVMPLRRQVRRQHRLLQQPLRGRSSGGGFPATDYPRCVQQVRRPLRHAEGERVTAPSRAVSERELHLSRFHSSHPVAPFAPPALPGFVATMRRSDFSMGVGPPSPAVLPAKPDPWRPPMVRSHVFPPPPLPLPSCLDWIPGVALERTLTQTDRPAREFTSVRCCG